jgi:radical SAM protein with 4Fe4S-binding SPASM domain
MKFESFKYLGHIVRSFGWLGNYNTYWGPKYNFCEPQRGFHYVFSTNGKIYHCPRTINNPKFCLGNANEGLIKDNSLKQQTILDKTKCASCKINTLCGGGCVVQKKFYPDLDCKEYASSIIGEFIALMTDKILKRAIPDEIVSINSLW